MNQMMTLYLRNKKSFDVSTEDVLSRISTGVAENRAYFYTREYIKTTQRTFAQNVEILLIHQGKEEILWYICILLSDTHISHSLKFHSSNVF